MCNDSLLARSKQMHSSSAHISYQHALYNVSSQLKPGSLISDSGTGIKAALNRRNERSATAGDWAEATLTSECRSDGNYTCRHYTSWQANTQYGPLKRCTGPPQCCTRIVQAPHSNNPSCGLCQSPAGVVTLGQSN